MIRLDGKSARRLLKATLVGVAACLVTLVFAFSPGQAMQWDDYQWTDMTLLWYRDSTALNNLVSGASTQVSDSIGQWRSSNTGAAIDFNEETEYPEESQVDVLTMDFDLSWGCIPGYTTLALAGDGETIIAGQAWLNNDTDGDCYFQWYTDGTMDNSSYTPAEVDVRTVAVHELGHTLALDHDCTPSSQVMCVTWTQKWNVTTDDKNELKAIYP